MQRWCLPCFPQDSFAGRDAPCARHCSQMNLVSMAAVAVVAEPELKWLSLWLRVRWTAVLVVLLASVLLLLLPLTLVEEQCQAVLKGLSFLKGRLGLGYVGITTSAGQTTSLSVTSAGLELLVLKSRAPPGA